VSGVPHPVIQRGYPGTEIFFAGEDPKAYLAPAGHLPGPIPRHGKPEPLLNGKRRTRRTRSYIHSPRNEPERMNRKRQWA
jgi:hypothetical protein